MKSGKAQTCLSHNYRRTARDAQNHDDTGNDGVHEEVLKCACQKSVTRFLVFIKMFWIYEHAANKWNILLIPAIYEYGDRILKITDV